MASLYELESKRKLNLLKRQMITMLMNYKKLDLNDGYWGYEPKKIEKKFPLRLSPSLSSNSISEKANKNNTKERKAPIKSYYSPNHLNNQVLVYKTLTQAQDFMSIYNQKAVRFNDSVFVRKLFFFDKPKSNF